ncbi:protein mono-ADP-ribosyltransferase TIPARP-like [Hypomesus transpacificus]|uniref:protein mono-ADP-ribosyltransferase TIPARP-like n=1 Tax=Hypomesus transpacificus TaxID=137520 RepID=UPI001F074AF2|nr:protein mono-ADP-ribosyltransferase TIPARP-like [Hypomesus transpacificus]
MYFSFKEETNLSTSKMKKRKESEISRRDSPSESPKVSFLSSHLLLLEIASDTNTSLPVWDSIRSQQVDIGWTVTPYSINVCFTPLLSKPVPDPGCGQISVIPRTTLAPTQPQTGAVSLQQIIIQSLSPYAGSDPNTPNVLVTFPQSTLQISPPPHPPGLPTPNQVLIPNSVILPLPFIIKQPQLPTQTSTSAKKDSAVASTSYQAQFTTSTPPLSACRLFHTKHSPDIQICEHFLINDCFLGLKCKQHHTSFPFHWQLRNSTCDQWLDFSTCNQVRLERLYCNVSRDEISLRDGMSVVTLSFDTMEVGKSEKYDLVRRLSNTSNRICNPHFPTEWHFFWWNYLSWEEYKQDVSKLLLETMASERLDCRFHIGSQEYMVNFLSMTQTNVTTGFERRIRWRPAYRSVLDILPHLRTGVLTVPTPADSPAGNFSVDPLKEFSTWYPPTWAPNPEQNSIMVDVPPFSPVYQKIYRLFHQSLPETSVEILNILQIQNVLHWDKFQRHKEHMLKCDPKAGQGLERHLFHGTPGTNIQDICHNNIDPRVAGVNGVSHGYGAYFACDARYSNTYATPSGGSLTQHMFLAKVLVGKMVVGKQKFRRPPPVSKNNCILYDSCVDSLPKPSIFVVFDRCQCYPYYLIKYRELPMVVELV